LALKSLLNISAEESFVIETPPVGTIPVDNILEITPAAVFAIAMQTQPQVKGNILRVMAADKNYLAAKAKLYPTISAFGQMNTAFNQTFTETYLNGYSESAIGYSKSGTTTIPVYTQVPNFATRDRSFGSIWNGYGTSLKNQLGKVIGIGINVPIFNGGQAKANIKRAQLDKDRWELLNSRDTLLLKQDVYTAYEQALGSYQTFMARMKQVQTAERSFDLASRRYEIGVMQTIEWLTNQNNLTRSKIDMLVAQFDYVFKMKVLEFFKGQGIKL
jgi:outer membrane protein